MTIQAKVGAFTIAGLILLFGMILALSDFHFSASGYNVYAVFPHVAGLNPGAKVCYAGLEAGSVEEIKQDGDKISVAMKIKNGMNIPRKSTVRITPEGVMGGKYINIAPAPDADMGDILQDGDVVQGQAEIGMESVMEGVNNTLLQVQTLMQSLNEMLGDPEVKTAVKDMAINMRDVTSNLKVMTASLSGMAVNTQADVQQMARNLNMMSGSLMRAADSVEQLVTSFNGDGETGENLKVAVRNLTTTSERIDHMAASLEDFVTDPEVADDLRATLKNVRGVSDRADRMMGTLENIKIKPSVETMYSGKADKWKTDADVTIHNGDSGFFKLGVNDIGEENKVDVIGGMRSGSIGAHAGVIESKAGIGADVYIGKRVTMSVDAFDPNDIRIKSRLSYEFMPDTFLYTQMDDINDSDQRATFVGLSKSF